MSRILETAWYRFRATFGRQWGGYLTVLVLIGLLGGLAMGAIAGARRTLASPSVYVASRNPFSFGVGTGVFDPQAGQNSGYDPSVINTMAHLPSVTAVVSQSGLNVVILTKEVSRFRWTPVRATARVASTAPTSPLTRPACSKVGCPIPTTP